MSTTDQTQSARRHGEALVAAERLVDNPALDPLLLRRLAEVMVSGVIDYNRLGLALRAAYDRASNPADQLTQAADLVGRDRATG